MFSRFTKSAKQDAPVQAAVHDDDQVYPVFLQDDTEANKKFVSWIMRFNDVLDADRLHEALSKLLEIGDWRKLGGRLRQKVSRSLFGFPCAVLL